MLCHDHSTSRQLNCVGADCPLFVDGTVGGCISSHGVFSRRETILFFFLQDGKSYLCSCKGCRSAINQSLSLKALT